MLAFVSRDWNQRRESLRRLDYAGFRRAKARGNLAVRLDLAKVWRRDRGKCYLCDRKLLFWEFTIDHVIPIARGGGHQYSNVKICCLSCNQSKGVRQEMQSNDL